MLSVNEVSNFDASTVVEIFPRFSNLKILITVIQDRRRFKNTIISKLNILLGKKIIIKFEIVRLYNLPQEKRKIAS